MGLRAAISVFTCALLFGGAQAQGSTLESTSEPGDPSATNSVNDDTSVRGQNCRGLACPRYQFCVQGTCFVRVGKPCNPRSAFCEAGATCVRDAGLRRQVCKTVAEVGESCEGRMVVCKETLVCERGFVREEGKNAGKVCKTVAVGGESCADQNVVCKETLVCEETSQGKVCKTKVGESCADQNAVCAKNLFCEETSQGKECKYIPGVLGEYCRGDGTGPPCDSDFTCVSEICKKVVKEVGQSCSGDHVVCGSEFFCDTSSDRSSEVCKYTPVEVGKSCKDDGTGPPCKNGLTCEDEVCKYTPVEVGKSCKDDGTGPPCKNGLTCEDEVCKYTPVGLGKSCKDDGTGPPCINGLSCHPYIKTCYKAPQLNQRCSWFNPCTSGLRCWLFKCRR